MLVVSFSEKLLPFLVFLRCSIPFTRLLESNRSHGVSLEMRWLPWQSSWLLLVPDEEVIFRLTCLKVRLQCFKLNSIVNWFESAKNCLLNRILVLLIQLVLLLFLFVFDQIAEVKLLYWDQDLHVTEFSLSIASLSNVCLTLKIPE